MITEDDKEQFIFGVSDGLTSALGVVIPLSINHQSMLAVVAGLAMAAAIGMSGGEFLSDKEGSWRRALAMAVASAVGTVLPALPFFMLHGSPAAFASGAICMATGVAISETKAHQISRGAAYLQTFAILALASVMTVGMAFLTGATG